MVKYLYIAYQYLFAIPVLVVMTFLTSVMTILCFWCPNAAFPIWWQRTWSKCFFWLLFLPVEVEGMEHIEPGKSYVFVSNHQSMLDVWLIYGNLPVVFKWIMKKEVDKIPFVGAACRYAGHVCVDRSNPRSAYQSLERMKQTLRNGVCTVVFPEGTRTKTGQMGRFKRGAFQIALDLGLDIVPISISGAFACMKPGQPYVTRGKIRLYVGEPMPMNIDRTQETAIVREQEEAFIEQVRTRIAEQVVA